VLCLAHPVGTCAASADGVPAVVDSALDGGGTVLTIGYMAITTALRAQRFRSSWVAAPATGLRCYRARKARTSAYRTSDGMARELLRPVID